MEVLNTPENVLNVIYWAATYTFPRFPQSTGSRCLGFRCAWLFSMHEWAQAAHHSRLHDFPFPFLALGHWATAAAAAPRVEAGVLPLSAAQSLRSRKRQRAAFRSRLCPVAAATAAASPRAGPRRAKRPLYLLPVSCRLARQPGPQAEGTPRRLPDPPRRASCLLWRPFNPKGERGSC